MVSVGVILGLVAFMMRLALPGAASLWLAGALGLVGLVSGVTRTPNATNLELLVWPVLALIVVAVVGLRPVTSKWGTVIAGGSIVLAGTIMLFQIGGSDSGIDVYLSHQSAAKAIQAGADPYGAAVRVPNTNPYVEAQEVIEGYSYPPLVLGVFGAAGIAFGDARWVTVVVVASLVAVTFSSAHRDALALVLMFFLAPIWRYFVFSGWTEMFSLVWFVLAARTWDDKPRASAVFLGLGLASKQYMILLLPLLLASKVDKKSVRLPVAFAAALVTFIPVVFWDPAGAFDVLVVRPLGIGFRPDTISLPGMLASFGISLEVPRLVWLGIVAVAGGLIGRRVTDGSSLLVGSGLTLGIAFALSLAFPNYWLLVAGLWAFGSMASRHRLENQVFRPAPTSPITST